jgi:hypothetical protein
VNGAETRKQPVRDTIRIHPWKSVIEQSLQKLVLIDIVKPLACYSLFQARPMTRMQIIVSH